MMRTISLAVCAATLMAGSAFAEKPATWTGLYVGAHGGAAWADWDGELYSSSVQIPGNEAYGFNPSRVTIGDNGWLGGFQIGHNQQFGPWVFGIELDASRASVEADKSFTNINGSFRWDMSTSMDWLATARVRLGWASDNLLIYATGGAAYARTEGRLVAHQLLCPTCPRTSATGSASENHLGYTIGGGFEWRLDRSWSIRSEYLYANLGKADYHLKGTEALTGNPHVTDSFPADLELHTLRVGINYRLE